MAGADMTLLIRLLQFSGHYFTFTPGKWSSVLEKFQRFRIVFVTVCMILSTASLFVGGIQSSLGIEMCYGVLGMLTAIQCLYMFALRKETEDLIQTIQHIRDEFQKGTDEQFLKDTRPVWKVIYFYWGFFNFIGFVQLVPFFVDLVIWCVWNTPRAFRVPMVMDSFLEKEPVRDLKYFSIIIVGNLWQCVGYSAHLGLDTFLFITCYSYSSMVNTFIKTLRLDSGMTPQQITAQIKRHAAHQQALFKLSLKMRSLFGFSYFIQNLFGAFCVCSLLYVLLSDDSGPVIMIANLLNLCSVVLGAFGCSSYVGQHVTDQSARVFDALYDFPWYILPPSDRKYFITMLSASRDPVEISFHGMLPLHMVNFMALLNTSYSYFMFMQTMLSK